MEKWERKLLFLGMEETGVGACEGESIILERGETFSNKALEKGVGSGMNLEP